MSIHVDITIQYSKKIYDDDLPDNWIEMDHEEKDEWVREWVEKEEQYDYVDIIWNEEESSMEYNR